MERISTGSSRADLVLGGGLPAGTLVVIGGRPGTGKTILAQQLAFANATPERPARYYTTLSEPHSKLIRHLENFAFFDHSKLDHGVSFLHLTEIAKSSHDNGDGLTAVVDQLVDDVYEHRPCVVVLDSSKALSQFADPEHLRQVVFELAGKISHSGTTLVMVGEYTGEDYDRAPEFAVADVIIELSNEGVGSSNRRWLRVHKLRGSSFLQGQHTFEITDEGYTVYPRLETVAPTAVPLADGRDDFGIAEIDGMVGGGIPGGDACLLIGPSGSGKTTLAMTWLNQALVTGDRALFVSLEESEEEILAKADRLGFDLQGGRADGRFRYLHAPTVRLDIDAFANRVRDVVAELRPDRIVVDALSDLVPPVRKADGFPTYVAALANTLREFGSTLCFTYEVTALGGPGTLDTVSNLVHDVFVLRYMERGAELGRVFSVLKMRNSVHDHGLLQFEIVQDGIEVLGEPGNVSQITGWTVLGGPAGA